jgi:hypothetical protein
LPTQQDSDSSVEKEVIETQKENDDDYNTEDEDIDVEASLPEDFPEDVYLPSRGTLIFSSETVDPQKKAPAFMLTYELEEEKETIKKEVAEVMEKENWESAGIQDMGQAVLMQFSKDERYASVNISVTEKEGIFSVTISCT